MTALLEGDRRRMSGVVSDPRLWRWAVAGGAGLVLVLAVVLRFTAPAGLWLDEAQSVAIARLPLRGEPGIASALRQDGSPPLYYLLLHGWMALFGESDAAVRAFSGVLSVAALPLAWLCGVRLSGSRWVGWAAVLLTATNPWMLRYATEARMYALVVVLVLVGVLAVDAVRRRPSLRRLAGLAMVSGALLLTHYWAFFLIGAASIVLGYVAVRQRARWAVSAAGAAVAGGALLFLPWLPSFLFQLERTGAPWADAASVDDLLRVPRQWAGGSAMLTVGLVLLIVAGAYLALPKRRHGALAGTPAAACAVVVPGTIVLAWVPSAAGVGAFASRYTAVVVPLALLLAAFGATVPPRRWGAVAVAAVSVIGLAVASDRLWDDRTQAGEVAAAMAASAAPGDVVVFCPDQLGPAVVRELAHLHVSGLRLVTYPEGRPPGRVDWVDYAERHLRADPKRFAARAYREAGPSAQLFLVQAPQPYRAVGADCAELASRWDTQRGARTQMVHPDPSTFEQMGLSAWGAPAGAGASPDSPGLGFRAPAGQPQFYVRGRAGAAFTDALTG